MNRICNFFIYSPLSTDVPSHVKTLRNPILFFRVTPTPSGTNSKKTLVILSKKHFLCRDRRALVTTIQEMCRRNGTMACKKHGRVYFNCLLFTEKKREIGYPLFTHAIKGPRLVALKFRILHTSRKSRARVCQIETEHGIIDTPAFVPVATNSALKGVTDHTPFPLIFCNTYHLIVHPGTEKIADLGGLHAFMNRNTPIITDSGGFQIFSLAYGSVTEEIKSQGKKKHSSSVIRVSDEGVLFKSYRDGRQLFLSPESSVQAQKDLGADIIIPLDELLPFHTDAHYFVSSCSRTYAWEKRSLDYHLKTPRYQSMYGVIHGGLDPVQRKIGCQFVEDHAFDGFAIGGSVGRNLKEMTQIVDITTGYLSKDRPVHLLGIGDLPSIYSTVGFGIDSFDSSYPTKAARHGLLLSFKGPIKIMNQAYARDLSPIDPDCTCLTCSSNISRAYLRHLFKAHEPNAGIWASIHNLHHMQEVMKDIRAKILNNEI